MSLQAQDKRMSMREAVAQFVQDGDSVYLGGFLHGEPHAAVHEMIRQGKRDLTVSTGASTTFVDLLIGAGCVARLITSYCWNPVPAPTYAFRRAVEKGVPRAIEIEEYSLLGLSLAYFAGALNLPFVATKTMLGSGFLQHQGFLGEAKYKVVASPFNGEKVCLIGPLRHNVGIAQVQRADRRGNGQCWGILGPTKYGLNSCSRVILCAEEVVDEEVVLRDPNRTIIPAYRVCAVVQEPWGSHPSYVQGCYDRDWRFTAEYARLTESLEGFQAFLEEWVLGVSDRGEYVRKIGRDRLDALRCKGRTSSPVDYGSHSGF